MPLTEEQVQIVKATVPILKDRGTDVTKLFYKTVLEEHPELNNVFNQTNQVNHHQAGALAGALYAYAAHIDDLGALSPAVEKISHKHASLYIQPEHYGIVGEGVLRAFGQILGSAFTSEIHDAWAAAYWQLANIMINREKQLYSEAEGWTDWREFRIANKVKESDEITSFYLEPLDGGKLPAYLPGQYISLLTDVPSFGYLQSRQYSLSDAPRSSYYRISVKKELGLDPQDPHAHKHPGWISNILHDEKKVGDVVKVSHPAGDFLHDPDKDVDGPIVLLSAGVGITPMISILNTILQRNSAQPVSFIHGARTTSTQAFGPYIKKQARAFKNIRATFFVKNLGPNDVVDRDYDHVGRLTLPKLAHTHSHDLYLEDAKTKYFVCGPEKFMSDIRRGLIDIGVDESRIKLEIFGTGDLPS
ncbi:Putative flavohemoprotein [Septoria linicola]|uniref:nitric oxide dioxygenase n=1 Tax=Septoria linicola TaxID=215465 RepID=A0A9Q9AN88_9PEZI|nr:Putative flavohemoprotein [Septoria linicola]